MRTDVPSYRVFRDGEFVEDVTDIRHLWRDDLVAFVLGCSFSFEEALMEAGLPLRYVEQGKNVPMFLTDIDTAPAGPFHGMISAPSGAPPSIISSQPTTVRPCPETKAATRLTKVLCKSCALAMPSRCMRVLQPEYASHVLRLTSSAPM